MIIGSPNYLSELSAGFRALYERLVFQHITYRREEFNSNRHMIPVLLIVTSNASAESYEGAGYNASLISQYVRILSNHIGKTRYFVSGNTLQVNDYDSYGWTLFDPEEKIRRRREVFPKECEQVFRLGGEMVGEGW